MTPRPATLEDVPEVLRLAGLMYGSIDQPAGEAWFGAVGHLLESRIDDGRTGIFVVDADEPGRLASCVAATIGGRLPGPLNPQGGTVAYVQWMCTDTAYRRRGLGRAVLAALLEWLWAREVWLIELHASEDGESLYRSLGFVDPPLPQLRLLRPPP